MALMIFVFLFFVFLHKNNGCRIVQWPTPVLAALVSGRSVVEPSGTPVIALQQLRLIGLVPVKRLGGHHYCKKAPEEVHGDRGRGDVDHHEQDG